MCHCRCVQHLIGNFLLGDYDRTVVTPDSNGGHPSLIDGFESILWRERAVAVFHIADMDATLQMYLLTDLVQPSFWRKYGNVSVEPSTAAPRHFII